MTKSSVFAVILAIFAVTLNKCVLAENQCKCFVVVVVAHVCSLHSPHIFNYIVVMKSQSQLQWSVVRVLYNG